VGTPPPTDRVSLLTPSDTARSSLAEGRPPLHLSKNSHSGSLLPVVGPPRSPPRQLRLSSNSRNLPHFPRFDPPGTRTTDANDLRQLITCYRWPNPGSSVWSFVFRKRRGFRKSTGSSPSLATPGVGATRGASVYTVGTVMNCGFVNHTSQAIKFAESL